MVVSVCACRSFCSVSFIWIWAGSVFLKSCCFALRSSVDLVPRDFPLLVPQSSGACGVCGRPVGQSPCLGLLVIFMLLCSLVAAMRCRSPFHFGWVCYGCRGFVFLSCASPQVDVGRHAGRWLLELWRLGFQGCCCVRSVRRRGSAIAPLCQIWHLE